MAFNIDCKLEGYEFRGSEKKVSQKGKPFVVVRLESPSGKTCEISTTEESYFPGLLAMQKATVCDWPVAAIAGKERSYIILTGEPVESEVAAL